MKQRKSKTILLFVMLLLAVVTAARAQTIYAPLILHASQAGEAPGMVQYGTIALTFENSDVWSEELVFPTPFKDAPVVVVQTGDNSYVYADRISYQLLWLSPTQVTIIARSAIPINATIYVNWIAIGP